MKRSNKSNTFWLLLATVLLSCLIFISCSGSSNKLLLERPDHGFVSRLQAGRWEESMLTGNGSIGALVPGDPRKERIILSHEKLFMPEYPPYDPPPIHKYLYQMKKLVLEGKGEEASGLLIKAGEEVGIDDMIWTNPLIPACQLEIESLKPDELVKYSRSVNYETGEAITAWQTEEGLFQRSVFASRPDQVIVVRFDSQDKAKLNVRMKLAQLPLSDSEKMSELEDEFASSEVIESVESSVKEDGTLTYTTHFQKKWKGSLKGYFVESKVIATQGSLETDGTWLTIRDADEILVLSGIQLSYTLPIQKETPLNSLNDQDYQGLLARHAAIQGEIFNRFSLTLGEKEKNSKTSEQLIKSSRFGKMNPELLTELMEAARYIALSSSGDVPPALQGLWGGTWRPAWSGDFTLNGNVPSAIASGMNTNLLELSEAYLNMMWSWMDDFRFNAKEMYQAPGIYVPSRASDSGKTYHFGDYYPHLLWLANGAWTAQFFYDYWLYTGNKQFLKEKTIPIMLAAAEFYEFMLKKDKTGKYNIIPSYSPELGPDGQHPLSINATMTVAAVKQLMRNLLLLSEQGWIQSGKTFKWKDILENLPLYSIDKSGDLKEWIWPGLENDNSHRHASHLYPLFYEVDPEFRENPELINAAKTAIENRLEYRRNKNGAEMAFGLVQKGLAAAHIKDVDHAYECVDWLCHSYWSPAFTAYHDPGEIFNTDICGGLPAVVTEMIVQSSSDLIELLPALPEQWSEGHIQGVLTRCGVTVDLEWKESKPLRANLTASRDTECSLKFGNQEWSLTLEKNENISWEPE